MKFLDGRVHAVAAKLEPLYEAQRRDILSGNYLQIDEVPWRIADSPGKCRKGYAWQLLDNRPQSHGLYFLYQNGSRAGTVPRAELRNFSGAIQADGYGVYDYFEFHDNVTLLGCMAHLRRKFTDAQTSHPQLAAQAVKWIELLYTLIESCDIVGVNLLEWLTRVLNNLHDDTPPDDLIRMLPYSYKQSRE